MRDLGVGDRLDGFEITDVVARGAMGSVFKALDAASGRVVALKVPHVQYESDVVFFERIRREVDHPNVVQILDTPEKSRVYIAMEFVEGRSLARLLRNGPLPLEQALDTARQVCAGLAAVHARGIVHRDLKPENIHLTASGQVKLLDFGIALLPSARRLTWSGLSAVLGTPDYTAPEQIRGRRGDARTDVYAVGTLLYEMLTGKLPFEAPNPAAVMRVKLHDRAKSPARYLRTLEPSLEATILRALEPDPRDRHANASELLDALTSRSDVRSSEFAGAAPHRRLWGAAHVVGVIVTMALTLLGVGSFL